MALKTTIADMRELMHEIMHNLEKSERGNRSAAQRARLCSLRFEKAAKLYRKESVAEAKKNKTASKPSHNPTAKKRSTRRKSKRKSRSK